MFIDTLEIEEALGEYYDFSDFTPEMWEEADKQITALCDARGIDDSDLDTYYAICDGVISRLLQEPIE